MSRDLLNYGAYVDFVQSFLVQAQYWHDPFNQTAFLVDSYYLADINN